MFSTNQRSPLHGLCLGGACVGVIFAAIAWSAIGGCIRMAVPPDDDPTTEPPTGAELFSLITEEDPYQNWAEFPDRQGTLPSVLPHGPMSRVFINGEVEAALDTEFTGQLPDGSIIVKENVGTDPQVTEAALTVMWKVAGFDPGNNDWFWANMTLDGDIVAAGKVQSCTACHGGVRGNDFVFVQRF